MCLSVGKRQRLMRYVFFFFHKLPKVVLLQTCCRGTGDTYFFFVDKSSVPMDMYIIVTKVLCLSWRKCDFGVWQRRQKKRWEDNIREWIGLEFARSQRAVENRENREKRRKLDVKSSVVPQRPSRLRDRWDQRPYIQCKVFGEMRRALLSYLVTQYVCKDLQSGPSMAKDTVSWAASWSVNGYAHADNTFMLVFQI